MYFDLEGKDCTIVIHALRTAADTYEESANTCASAGDTRTAEHFALQAEEARNLADTIEEEC